VAARRQRLFAGSPQTVVARLKEFVRETQADEVMVTSSIFDFDARVRSYELLMEAWRAG